MISKLAIVIPAYKLAFFDKALSSIASQTNKNFTLYIGDDNSPEDLYSVVNNYETDLTIVYKKFNDNLGNISVVAHWNRCIAMTKSEKWIWLFSDDDMISEDCVELFYQAIENTSARYDLYRFNCSIIDQDGNSVTNRSTYPQIQTSLQFLVSRLCFQHHSYIVNCIFSRGVFVKHNGFIDFHGAWAADDATWILFGQEKGIYTLNNGLVQWRISPINISGNTSSLLNRQRKYKGTEAFIEWIYKWAHQNKIQLDDHLVMKWFTMMLGLIGYRRRFWVYLKSRTFRTFFWNKNYRYQLALFFQGRQRNF